MVLRVLASLLCAVVGATAARADSPLLDHATAALMQALDARYTQVTRWDVRPLGQADREAPGADAAQLRVVQIGPRSAVRMRSREGDGELHQRTVWFAVQGMQQVLTAERSFAAGDVLDAQSAVLRERDVLAANCEPLATTADLERLRTRIAIRAGAVLCSRDVEPRPAVARNEAVTVRYVGRTVALTTRGVAQADAEVGRPVTIRNPSSREKFRAVVSAPGEVTVHD